MFKHSKSNSVNFIHAIEEKASDIYNELPPVKKRRKRSKFFLLLKIISISFLSFFILLLIFVFVNYAKLRGVVDTTLAGKNHIENSILHIKSGEYKTANDLASLAEIKFATSNGTVKEYRDNIFFNKIEIFQKQIDNFYYLLTTAELLASSVERGSDMGLKLQSALDEDKSFMQLSRDDKRRALDFIHNSVPELNQIKTDINLASENFKKVNTNSLLWFFREKIFSFDAKLEEGRMFLDKVIPLTQLIPAFSGYPEKSSFLVLLQNSDELRPTGGFIGTYGILETDSGEISRFDTHNIYHMDMPVKDDFKVEPPLPLKKYLGVENWYMRDGNWSPDWPTSALKLEWFFNEENKLLPEKNQINNFEGKFNGVIGITPDLVTSLLEVIGPVYIEGEEYNKDNFVDLLQYRVEKGYEQLGVSSWNRKEVIGDILKEIKIKFFDLGADDLFRAVNVLDNNLLKKNFVIFLRDSQLENLVKDQGWSGEVIESESDYLMVVDANMAALKTDRVMKKSMSYKIDQGVNGIFSELKIDYANNGEFDWKTTRYRSYTRIYVPMGSELIRIGGVDEKDVITTTELGKTVFNVFFEVEPQKIKNLYFYYKLPDVLSEQIVTEGKYQLNVQKQPGNKIDSLSIDLNLINNVKSYSPTGFYSYKIGDSKLLWLSDLEADKEFIAEF